MDFIKPVDSNEGARIAPPQPQQTIQPSVPPRTSQDEELEELLAQQRASIKVFGAGGGGNNTINRIL